MTNTSSMENLVVVGSGPAGLSAAIYAKQAGFNPLVLRGSESSLIATTDRVNNYLGLGDIGGLELHRRLQSHYEDVCGKDRSKIFEVVRAERIAEGFELENGQGEILHARAVIWATGAQPKKLNVPGEESTEAVSYCATCDGDFYSGDPALAVVGGGDSAMEEALYLAELVDQVHLLVRSTVRAKEELYSRVQNHPKISVMLDTSVLALEENESMELELQLDGDRQLNVSGLFGAIGHVPNTEPIRSLAELDYQGFVVKPLATGFFCAGDVFGENHRQAIIAAGDGARAGIEAAEYLRVVLG